MAEQSPPAPKVIAAFLDVQRVCDHAATVCKKAALWNTAQELEQQAVSIRTRLELLVMGPVMDLCPPEIPLTKPPFPALEVAIWEKLADQQIAYHAGTPGLAPVVELARAVKSLSQGLRDAYAEKP